MTFCLGLIVIFLLELPKRMNNPAEQKFLTPSVEKSTRRLISFDAKMSKKQFAMRKVKSCENALPFRIFTHLLSRAVSNFTHHVPFIPFQFSMATHRTHCFFCLCFVKPTRMHFLYTSDEFYPKVIQLDTQHSTHTVLWDKHYVRTLLFISCNLAQNTMRPHPDVF
jgi:hypothetical protein